MGGRPVEGDDAVVVAPDDQHRRRDRFERARRWRLVERRQEAEVGVLQPFDQEPAPVGLDQLRRHPGRVVAARLERSPDRPRQEQPRAQEEAVEQPEAGPLQAPLHGQLRQRGRHQGEGPDASGMALGKPERESAAEGVADQVARLHSEAVEEAEHRALEARKAVGSRVGRPLAETESGEVGRDHPEPWREAGQDVAPGEARATEAVEEQHRLPRPGLLDVELAAPHFEELLIRVAAADLGERARRAPGALQQAEDALDRGAATGIPGLGRFHRRIWVECRGRPAAGAPTPRAACKPQPVGENPMHGKARSHIREFPILTNGDPCASFGCPVPLYCTDSSGQRKKPP